MSNKKGTDTSKKPTSTGTSSTGAKGRPDVIEKKKAPPAKKKK